MRNTRSEFLQMMARAEELTVKYNWYEKKVRPYSYPITIREILNDCDDYDNCTAGSRMQLFSLLKGTLEILESWEKFELTKVAVIYNGRQIYLTPETITALRECGDTVEIIQEGGVK